MESMNYINKKLKPFFFFLIWYFTFVYPKYANNKYFIFCCFSKFPKKINTIFSILRKRFCDHFSLDISFVSDIWEVVNIIPGVYFPLRCHLSYRTFFSMEIFVKKDGVLTYVGFWYKIGYLKSCFFFEEKHSRLIFLWSLKKKDISWSHYIVSKNDFKTY